MIFKAIKFATLAHAGQFRKYTGEPYIIHPISVAEIVSTVTNDEGMLSAAILHDTVEDTPVTLEQIRVEFGGRVMALVDDLTDQSKPEDGNRKTRRALDCIHTARAHPDSKTIKLADLIHNTGSIAQHDKNFAVLYMREKQKLLEVLQEGNKILLEQANNLVKDYYLGRLHERHK